MSAKNTCTSCSTRIMPGEDYCVYCAKSNYKQENKNSSQEKKSTFEEMFFKKYGYYPTNENYCMHFQRQYGFHPDSNEINFQSWGKYTEKKYGLEIPATIKEMAKVKASGNEWIDFLKTNFGKGFGRLVINNFKQKTA